MSKTTKKKSAKKTTKKKAAKKAPATAAAPAKDANGLGKADKANITRLANDFAGHKQFATVKHLSSHKIRKALMADKGIVRCVVENGTLAAGTSGFIDKVVAVIQAIPEGRARMTPEEREKYELQRRAGILATAKDGTPNAFSNHALMVAYMQGLKGEERETAKTKFNRATSRPGA